MSERRLDQGLLWVAEAAWGFAASDEEAGDG